MMTLPRVPMLMLMLLDAARFSLMLPADASRADARYMLSAPAQLLRREAEVAAAPLLPRRVCAMPPLICMLRARCRRFCFTRRYSMLAAAAAPMLPLMICYARQAQAAVFTLRARRSRAARTFSLLEARWQTPPC